MGRQVVGFYKEHGKTKPITKSVAQLKQKKIVRGSKQFAGIKPKGDAVSLARKFFDDYPVAASLSHVGVRARPETLGPAVTEQMYTTWLKISSEGKDFDKARKHFVQTITKSYGERTAGRVDVEIEAEAMRILIQWYKKENFPTRRITRSIR